MAEGLILKKREGKGLDGVEGVLSSRLSRAEGRRGGLATGPAGGGRGKLAAAALLRRGDGRAAVVELVEVEGRARAYL